MYKFCWHKWRTVLVFEFSDSDYCFSIKKSLADGMICLKCKERKLRWYSHTLGSDTFPSRLDKDCRISNKNKQVAYDWLNQQDQINNVVNLKVIKND